MTFPESEVSEIATSVLAVKSRPVVVGIDGPDGSGKSTLARDLADYLCVPVAIVHGDDFYSDMSEKDRTLLSPEGGYEDYFDWRRLQSEVLESIRSGAKDLRYQRFDWNAARMGSWIELPVPEVVIVEGVYMLRPQLRGLLDYAVYVRASEETTWGRLMARGENPDEWIRKWIAAYSFYSSHVKPWRNADLVVEGEGRELR